MCSQSTSYTHTTSLDHVWGLAINFYKLQCSEYSQLIVILILTPLDKPGQTGLLIRIRVWPIIISVFDFLTCPVLSTLDLILLLLQELAHQNWQIELSYLHVQCHTLQLLVALDMKKQAIEVLQMYDEKFPWRITVKRWEVKVLLVLWRAIGSCSEGYCVVTWESTVQQRSIVGGGM